MPRTVLVVPTGHGVGLTSVCLGLVRALDRIEVPAGFLKPFAQPWHGTGPDRSTALVRLISDLDPPDPLPQSALDEALGLHRIDELMERVVAVASGELASRDVVIVEGLVPGPDQVYSQRVNLALAKALDADVLLVAAAGDWLAAEVAADAAIVAGTYRAGEEVRVVGVVVNRVPSRAVAHEYASEMRSRGLALVGSVALNPLLAQPRVLDLARSLGATVLAEGDLASRRISGTAILARSVPGLLSAVTEGQLLVFPGDRSDALMAAALAALGGTRIAAVLLTAGVEPDPQVWELIRPALDTGLPVLLVDEMTYGATADVLAVNPEVAIDDAERAEDVAVAVADALDEAWVRQLGDEVTHRRLSPAAFRHRVVTMASAARRRIVLPEGAEPRTLQAAVECVRRGIADCVLLAAPAEVDKGLRALGLSHVDGLTVIDPVEVAESYVPRLVELRAHKGMTEGMAREQLGDTVMLGTLMLHGGEVDGLVSGAVHTTAHTVRPALQLIKTAPGAALVSSVFFMCLPDQVVVYGDCAVNPDPTAEQLADIALQSAGSAELFGIEPRVAMLSYSTGTSGEGSDVRKVAEATRIARDLRPELAIDGPLQYDAAAIASVAKSKRPDSPVAGRATVFIFPDLNTGNTTYKAVQRGADVVSVGPMLQGLAKPVNDLSRGALVEDIVYTIALTAVQAAGVPAAVTAPAIAGATP
ncbi:MAG: pta-2 [Frankiales bacterium]|nr:pta-2 [Frankiales bacterium]